MDRIIVNPELSARTVENDLYILDRKNSFIHSLNEGGSILWSVVKIGGSVDDMVRALCDEFDVDETTARADAEEFLTTLKERLLVESV